MSTFHTRVSALEARQYALDASIDEAARTRAVSSKNDLKNSVAEFVEECKTTKAELVNNSDTHHHTTKDLSYTLSRLLDKAIRMEMYIAMID